MRRGAPPLAGANIPERFLDRLQYAAVYFGQRRIIHVVQIYGHAEGDAKAAEDYAQLEASAAAFLRSLEDAPAPI